MTCRFKDDIEAEDGSDEGSFIKTTAPGLDDYDTLLSTKGGIEKGYFSLTAVPKRL